MESFNKEVLEVVTISEAQRLKFSSNLQIEKVKNERFDN